MGRVLRKLSINSTQSAICPEPAAVVSDPQPGFAWLDWMGSDGTHPSELGHQYMADLIIFYLTQVLDDVARRPLEATDNEEAAAELPKPMFKVAVLCSLLVV